MKIMSVFGTRPEAIKMAPLVKTLEKDAAVEHFTCVTSQHKEMLQQVLRVFDIIPNADLNLMRESQSLSEISANLLTAVTSQINTYEPDLVLVHGDTSTCAMATLSAFYCKVPVGHVEAGLRTFDLASPFPEELNRQIVSKMATFHFAPTKMASQNLLREGIKENIIVTGNTGIDALLSVTANVTPHVFGQGILNFLGSEFLQVENYILVTGHRRENFGVKFENFCESIKRIALNNPNLYILFPVHLNPNVRRTVFANLVGVDNIMLVDPLDYLQFSILLKFCKLVITDSGGIQEEAPTFGKPIIVTRENTERPEAVSAGFAQIVGTDVHSIVSSVQHVLDHPDEYAYLKQTVNPYGDGNASIRIVDHIKNHFLI